MDRFLKILIAVSTCFALASCGAKSDSQKSVDDANKSVEQAKKDADKAAEDAKKKADEANQTSNSLLDITSPGGQPGAVSLSGALLVDEKTLDSKVTVSVQSGKSWKGVRPDVTTGTVTLKLKMGDSSAQELEKIKDDKTFVNLGCDISTRSEIKDLSEQQLDPEKSSAVAIIKANTVLICGANPIKANMTLITAKNVILSGVQQTFVGAVSKMTSITTSDLTIEGDNKISSKGEDASSTLLQGPSISIGAEKISGAGKLDILSEGSSYIKGDAK